MTKFTKGPWLRTERTFVYALGPKETNVFFCDVQSAGKERASKEECEANAALIAAAPELYEMLEIIAISMECYHGVDTDSVFELLAKARGES